MPDRLFFPLIIAVVLSVIGLGAVWPQGDGDRSPGVFGHTPTQQTAAARAALVREAARAVEAAARAKAAELGIGPPAAEPAAATDVPAIRP